MNKELYQWMHDDITWCGNECSYTKCERNMANKLQKEGLFSMTMFKGTEACPLSNRPINKSELDDSVNTKNV